MIILDQIVHHIVLGCVMDVQAHVTMCVVDVGMHVQMDVLILVLVVVVMRVWMIV